MKKLWLLVLLFAAAGVAVFLSFGGGAQLLSGDSGSMRAQALQFMEDIQFKDFDRAARYHAPEDRDTVDIPYLIERLFHVKPEFLDIQEFRVLSVDVDSTGRRGRSLVWSKVKLLNKNQVEEPEIMFYWRKHDDGQWYMKLEDSLKAAEKRDPDKKH